MHDSCQSRTKSKNTHIHVCFLYGKVKADITMILTITTIFQCFVFTLVLVLATPESIPAGIRACFEHVSSQFASVTVIDNPVFPQKLQTVSNGKSRDKGKQKKKKRKRTCIL